MRIYLRRHKNEFSGLMWLDDLHQEMRGPADPVLSADDQARGFYLFSRSVMVASHIVYLQHVLAEYRLQKNTKLP